MKYKIQQRTPNFVCDGRPCDSFEVESLEDFLNLPFVQRFSLDPSFKGFYSKKVDREKYPIEHYPFSYFIYSKTIENNGEEYNAYMAKCYTGFIGKQLPEFLQN